MRYTVERFVGDAYNCWSKIKSGECRALAVNGGFCRYWRICRFFDEAYEKGWAEGYRSVEVRR